MADNSRDALARGSQLSEQRQQYAAYVEQGLLDDIEDIEDLAEATTAQSILGKERFVARVRRIVRARTERDHDASSSYRQLLADSLETALRRVAQTFGVPVEELTAVHRGRRGHEARAVALWLAQERCGALLSFHYT